MTGTSASPPSPGPSRPYTGGQVAMIVIGMILLAPGICSLGFMVAMIEDIRRGDPYLELIAGLWVVCFLISAVGVALIYLARRNARKGA